MSKDAQSYDADDQKKTPTHFGTVVHSLGTQSERSKVPRLAVELTGVGGAVLVPIGLALMEGALGIGLAVLGGLTALAACLISAKKYRQREFSRIDICEMGIICCQGKTTRELWWNEIVDITCKKMHARKGTEPTALVFETANSSPTILMVGGTYNDKDVAQKLLEVLQKEWITVWCRRAKVRVEHGSVSVGRAMVNESGVVLDDRNIAWDMIKGVYEKDGIDCLRTSDGQESLEAAGTRTLFPSAARRIAALAEEPPRPHLLPPVSRSKGAGRN